MSAIITVAVAAVALIFFFRLWKTRPNHWANVPGPKRNSWLIGNRLVQPKEEREAEPDALLRQYSEEYGTTFVFPDVLGHDKLYTSDPVTMAFVLSDIDTFQITDTTVEMIKLVSGGGLVAAYSHEHKRMRRALSPSFSVAQLRKSWSVLAKNAALLSKRMGEAAGKDGSKEFNCCPLLDSAALDAIAEAGFGYKTGALEDGIENSVLAKTYSKTVEAALGGRLSMLFMMAIGNMISSRIVGLPLTHTNRVLLQQKGVVDKVAADIIASRKESLKGLDKETIESELVSEKDILSSIVRHNMVSPPHNALTDEELVGQVQTFLFAGFETTATTFSWCLWHLAKDLTLQERLRKEIGDYFFEAGITSVAQMSYEQVWDDKLTLVRMVLNETLRMHPPVHTIERCVKKPGVLPVPSLKGETGIVVKPGDKVVLGNSTFNFREKYFGENVHTFNPDRWLNLPQEHEQAPLPQQGSLNFSSGSKGCIGAKFAQSELRSFLIELVMNFRFEPSNATVLTRQALVLRPTVIRSDGSMAAEMLLKVTRL